jgi:hypothetical protein
MRAITISLLQGKVEAWARAQQLPERGLRFSANVCGFAWNEDTVLPFCSCYTGCGNSRERTMQTYLPKSRRGYHASGIVAVIALLTVAAGGYLYYRNAERAEVSSELQQTPVPRASDAEGTSALASPADAASNPSSQRISAAANASTEPPPNQGSPAPAPATDNAAPPSQAKGAPAPAKSKNATGAAAGIPENGQSKPTSLPTNDIAYVQKSDANIRSEPSLRGKRVGKASKGTKVNVLSRTGKWVQVESGETKGWISGNLLSDRLP